MTVRLEQFATGPPAATATWAVVGDLRRLPEWTDADRVELDEGPVAVDTAFVTVDTGRRLNWRATTVEPRLLEVVTATDAGEFGLGVRVARDPLGSRLVLAAAVSLAGPAGDVRARLWTAPALRRRFDRWATAALRVAAREELPRKGG